MVDVYSGEVLTSTSIYAPLKGSSVDVLMKQAANDIMEAYKNGEGIIRDKLQSSINSQASAGRGEGLKQNSFRKKVDEKSNK